jgi:hypothetical protein
MSHNNSNTNRNIRRLAALKRFSIDKQKVADDETYLARKELEKSVLESKVKAYA